jgi:hypothetical protein
MTELLDSTYYIGQEHDYIPNACPDNSRLQSYY